MLSTSRTTSEPMEHLTPHSGQIVGTVSIHRWMNRIPSTLCRVSSNGRTDFLPSRRVPSRPQNISPPVGGRSAKTKLTIEIMVAHGPLGCPLLHATPPNIAPTRAKIKGRKKIPTSPKVRPAVASRPPSPLLVLVVVVRSKLVPHSGQKLFSVSETAEQLAQTR